MNHPITLESINIAQKEQMQIGKNSVETGIYKRPINQKIHVSKHGLPNDAIADLDNHGGVDQAVYLYSRADYDWWAEQLGRDLPAGMFGENLTVSSFGGAPLRVGDRIQINDLLLEITAPRIPCAKFGTKMGDMGFVKQFVAAERPGAYARVLHEGEITAGDPVEWLPTDQDYPLLVDSFRLWYSKEKDAAMMKKWLEAPVAERVRSALLYWLEN